MHKHFFSLLILLMTLNANAVIAVETWQPKEHPASILRLLHGFTEASHQMYISSEVSALIKSIPVDTGDRITDKHIITLDDRLAQIELRLAQTQEQQARNSIQLTQANFKIAESLLKYRLAEKERSAALIENDVASDEQYKAMVFQFEQAQLAIANQLTRIDDAKQQLAVAQANTQRAQILLDRHSIALPHGWTVSKRLAQVHSLAQPGTQLLELINTQTLVIRFNLSEDEVRSLRGLAQIQIILEQNDAVIPVTIKSINPAFDPLSRKRSVELQANADLFPEASGGLKCMLKLSLDDPNNAVVIPKTFINERFEQFRVQDTDKKWHPIIIMRDEGDNVIIQSTQLPSNCVLQIPELN